MKLLPRLALCAAGVLVGFGLLSNGIFAPYSVAVRVVMLLIGGLLVAGSLALTIGSPKSHTESDPN
jgi:hypothetical protein